MGWTSGWKSKDELVRERLAASRNSMFEVADHSLVGNHLWVLLRVKDGAGTDRYPDGHRAITLNLLGSRGGDWGYKVIDETSHPFYYDCPARLLDASDEVGESAVEWRRKCREHRGAARSRRTFIAGLTPGDSFLIDGDRCLTYVRPLAESRAVVASFEGREYRVAKSRIEGPAPSVAAAA